MQRPGLTQETVHGNLGLQKYLEALMGYSENLSLGNIPGKKMYVDSAKAGDGTSWKKAFSDLDEAFAAAAHNDSIQMAPGTYTGNYTAPDDTVARNLAVFGINPGMPGIRGGVNLVASDSALPIITTKASGGRFSNLCLRPGATSAGIKLYADISTTNYIAGAAGGIAQGVTIDHCTFWGGGTGKYGILSQGDEGVNSPHFANIINNHFIFLNAVGAAGIYGADDSNPHIGWRVIGNQFESCRSHINCHAKDGWVGSRFENNTFPQKGVYAFANDRLIDVRATATPEFTGGNQFVANFFGISKSNFSSADGSIRTNDYDEAMGNMCYDGVQTGDINH